MLGEIPEAGRKAEVLFDREVTIECGLLKHEPDVAPDREAIDADVVTGHARRSARRGEQGGEQVDGGGLAGAIGAEKAEELAFPHLQVEPIEGADRAEILAKAAGVDRGGGHPFAARARDAGAAR